LRVVAHDFWLQPDAKHLRPILAKQRYMPHRSGKGIATMQPRLRRSKTEKMIAGVCGGLAEYFAIDPVIVRLIFVLGTLTTGIGILVYPVLWLIMPVGSSAFGAQPNSLNSEELRRRVENVGQEAASFGQSVEREAHEVWQTVAGTSRRGSSAPPASPYYDDTSTGATGATERLYADPTVSTHIAAPPARPRKRFGWAGVVLIGIGVMLLADFFQISTQFVFPLILIAAGIAMLVRKS
jgi:phage shock protein C